MTFEKTEWHVGEHWKVGDVIRRQQIDKDGQLCEPQSFFDVIILGFSKEGFVLVSRPYAFVSGGGTTGPGVLLGAETYSFPAINLEETFFGTRFAIWSKVGDRSRTYLSMGAVR